MLQFKLGIKAIRISTGLLSLEVILIEHKAKGPRKLTVTRAATRYILPVRSTYELSLLVYTTLQSSRLVTGTVDKCSGSEVEEYIRFSFVWIECNRFGQRNGNRLTVDNHRFDGTAGNTR